MNQSSISWNRTAAEMISTVYRHYEYITLGFIYGSRQEHPSSCVIVDVKDMWDRVDLYPQ